MRLHELHRIGRPKSMAGAAIVAQQLLAVCRGRHGDAKAGDGLAHDIAAIDRVLPDRQPKSLNLGQDVRQVSITSEYSRGSRAIHSTRSSTSGSVVSTIGFSSGGGQAPDWRCHSVKK
jgi:hypothetical protein